LPITTAFAGIAVADLVAALGWYERLLGRPADMFPNENEAVWQLTDTGLIYVVRDSARAGGALLTLIVDDLDEQLADLAGRGLTEDAIEGLAGVGRKAVITDPEGNTIAFAELVAPADPSG
jgi:catechol 2,3-dioxygenase-like lactoylglutathione lyase family enzyme